MSREWGMINAYFVCFIFAGLGIWYVFISFGRERIPIVMYVVICKKNREEESYLDRHSQEIRRIIGSACLLLVHEVKPFDDWANVIRFIISRYTSTLMWKHPPNMEVIRWGGPSVFVPLETGAFLVF